MTAPDTASLVERLRARVSPGVVVSTDHCPAQSYDRMLHGLSADTIEALERQLATETREAGAANRMIVALRADRDRLAATVALLRTALDELVKPRDNRDAAANEAVFGSEPNEARANRLAATVAGLKYALRNARAHLTAINEWDTVDAIDAAIDAALAQDHPHE